MVEAPTDRIVLVGTKPVAQEAKKPQVSEKQIQNQLIQVKLVKLIKPSYQIQVVRQAKQQ